MRLLIALGLVGMAGPVRAMDDQIVQCPVNEVSTGISTPLPEGWWNTPQLGRLAGAEVRQIGSETVLACLYQASGKEFTVMRRLPDGVMSCQLRPSGFSFACKGQKLPAAANDLQGKICQASIQNQIEWDYKGSTRWARSNLEKICRNASDSLQPGTCFKRAMHGNINHGNGTRWKWRHALRLCAGTRNANSTIACFTSSIDQQKPWRQAIEDCRARL